MIPRQVLDSRSKAAIRLYAAAPVGLQLSDPAERAGRCWRASTRFIAALRHEQSDGCLLLWSGEGWTHGAVLVAGSPFVVDWTVSQFEDDPAKAAAYEFPMIRRRREMDAHLRSSSSVLKFEDPFWAKTDLVPEQLLPWELARVRIPGLDRPQ